MMTNLLNLLPMLFGFTQATKHAAIATSPTIPADSITDTPNVATPAVMPVAELPLPTAESPVHNRFAWEKPVRNFQVRPHPANGFDMGYHSHNEDHFKMGAAALRADFTKAVMDTMRLLDQIILELRKTINECGDLTPTYKGNLQLELEQLTTDRTYWETQLILPQVDPKSEFAPSYAQFRVGYNSGMQRYHNDKCYSDANGLSHLIS